VEAGGVRIKSGGVGDTKSGVSGMIVGRKGLEGRLGL